MSDPSTWQAKAAAIKAELAAKFPKEWTTPDSLLPLPLDISHIVEQSKLLDRTELEIIALDATGIRDDIASRKFTSGVVTTAFAKAAAVVHQATNCLVDFFPEEAMERASRWDHYMGYRCLSRVSLPILGPGRVGELIEDRSNRADGESRDDKFRRSYGDPRNGRHFSDGGARIRQAAADSGEPLLPLTEWIMSQHSRERTAEEIMNVSSHTSRIP